MNDFLSMKNITKLFTKDKLVLDQVNLNIKKKGDIVFLVGANGAGKTTLINILLGLTSKNNGSVYLEDQELNAPYSTEVKRTFGFIPHEPLHIEYLSAIENLQYFCSIYKKKMSIKELENLLESYNLDGKDPKLLKYFSRGMKQKLSLCFIDVINPEIIVMDEPTTGLDIISSHYLESNIIAYAKKGKSILVTTHDIAFCKALADDIYILNKGKTKKLNDEKSSDQLDLSHTILNEMNELG